MARIREVSTKLNQVRAKRRLKAFRNLLIFVAFCAVVAAYLSGMLDSTFFAAQNLFDEVMVSLDRGRGYPLAVNLSGLKEAAPMGGGIAAVTESDLLLLSSSAKQLRVVQHGYASPSLIANSSRVVLYSRGANELKVEGISKNLTVLKLENELLCTAISQNSYLAVATKSERNLSQISVYDAFFEPIWYYYLNQLPTKIAFSKNNVDFVAATVIYENQELATELHLLNVNSDTEPGIIHISNGVLLDMRYLDETRIIAVFDSFVAVYDTLEQKELYRYNYGGASLIKAAIEENTRFALYFGSETQPSINNIVLLDGALQKLSQIELRISVDNIAINRYNLYVTKNKQIKIYDFEGNLVDEQSSSERVLKAIGSNQIYMLTSKQVFHDKNLTAQKKGD